MTDRGSDDFGWTALGQMSQAAVSGQTARDYTYDAFGRRVKTVVGSQTNRFLYHGWHMIGEYDSTAGNWLWQEGPWNSGERMLEHIARDTNDLDTDTNTTEYRQYAVHEDFQDTLWGLSDTAAAVGERYFYTDPYGKSETKNGAGTNIGEFATIVFQSKRMHGSLVERVTGLCDQRFRWNILDNGSWASRDPGGVLEAWNVYQSCLDDPLTREDPYGLWTNRPGQKLCKNQIGGHGMTGACFGAFLIGGDEGVAMQTAIALCVLNFLDSSRKDGKGCVKYCRNYLGSMGLCRETQPPDVSNPFWWTWPGGMIAQSKGMTRTCKFEKIMVPRSRYQGANLAIVVSCSKDTYWMVNWYCDCDRGTDVGFPPDPGGSCPPPSMTPPSGRPPSPPNGGPPGAVTPPSSSNPLLNLFNSHGSNSGGV